MVIINLSIHATELHKHECGPFKILRRVKLQHRARTNFMQEVIQIRCLGSFHLPFLSFFSFRPRRPERSEDPLEVLIRPMYLHVFKMVLTQHPQVLVLSSQHGWPVVG